MTALGSLELGTLSKDIDGGPPEAQSRRPEAAIMLIQFNGFSDNNVRKVKPFQESDEPVWQTRQQRVEMLRKLDVFRDLTFKEAL